MSNLFVNKLATGEPAIAEYAFSHLSAHLYTAGDFKRLIKAFQSGFLDRKLQHFGDPSLLLPDYEFGFRASESSANSTDMLIVSLHRAALADQAHLFARGTVESVMVRLAVQPAYHSWFYWCLGLAQLLPEFSRRLDCFCKLLKACITELESDRVLDLITAQCASARLDTLSALGMPLRLEELAIAGYKGMMRCLTEVVPILRRSPDAGMTRMVESLIVRMCDHVATMPVGSDILLPALRLFIEKEPQSEA